jgi:hypothetical protein
MKKWVYMLVLFPALVSLSLTGAKNRVYSGDAVELSSKTKVYTEQHEEILEAGKHTGTLTTYRDPSGKVIARRKLNFKKSFVTPDFKLEDLRSGYIEGAELTSGGVRIFWKEKKDSPQMEKLLKADGAMVVDGGFNYFVKDNWEDLKKGKTLSFNFVVPAEQDYYRFRVRKTGEGTHQGKKTLKVNLEVDNFLMRAFVDPIQITYDVQNKRILVYEGISNIDNGSGKSYIVRLSYPDFGP